MSTRCSTCGEELEPLDRRCPVCDTPVRRDVPGGTVPLRVRRCPRCGYQGEGIKYFRRLQRLVLLVGLALFTYGLGGVIYWLARRKHRVCPNCGLGWEHASRRLPPGPQSEEGRVPAGPPDESDLPSNGIKRRVLGVLGILVAALLISVGIVETELAAVATGGVFGLGGATTFWWGWRALQGRRDALMSSLQRRVLLLASRKGGTLTVTEVAADLDLSLEAAEKVLISMDDGFRVRSEITREGLLLYEFPEIQHRARLERGEEG